MKKTGLCLIIAIMIIAVSSCKNDKMENKTKFSYGVSVTAPREYPVEVYYGYLSADKKFITTVPKDGVEDNGWNAEGSNSGSGGSTMPNFLELTWLSYAEKKFWKVEAELPSDKILAYFREGFIFKDSNKNDTIIKETYDRIVIGTAPGGVAVVWLAGNLKRVEIGRYQAKETYVDKMKFQPVKDPDESQQEFFETYYEVVVPDTVRKKIKKEGLPFGLWDKYRKKYKWRFNCTFYKQDKNTFQNVDFFNGEYTTLYEDELDKKVINSQALPYRAEITFKVYWCENEFDAEEIMAAFEKLSKNHPGTPIEIEVRPDFIYRSVQFTVKCEGEEIPLKNTKVKMWKRNLEK